MSPARARQAEGAEPSPLVAWRRTVVRGGVALVAVVATLLCLARLDEVLGLYDFRADRASAQGYLERLYADEGVVGNRDVVEEARARMPADARYRVVIGPRLRSGNRFTPLVVGEFLNYFLLPRRQVADDTADWVFCFGCDPAALGARFEPVAGSGTGISFGRLPK